MLRKRQKGIYKKLNVLLRKNQNSGNKFPNLMRTSPPKKSRMMSPHIPEKAKEILTKNTGMRTGKLDSTEIYSKSYNQPIYSQNEQTRLFKV